MNGSNAYRDPYLASIFADGLAFKVMHAFQSLQRGQELFATSRIGKALPGDVNGVQYHLFRRIVAECSGQGWIYAEEATVRYALKDTDDSIVEYSAIVPLRLTECVLRFFAVSYVPTYPCDANDPALVVAYRYFRRQDLDLVACLIDDALFPVKERHPRADYVLLVLIKGTREFPRVEIEVSLALKIFRGPHSDYVRQLGIGHQEPALEVLHIHEIGDVID